MAVENRSGEAAAVLAGELPTRPTIDAVAAGPLAAMQRLGRLQLELRARAAHSLPPTPVRVSLEHAPIERLELCQIQTALSATNLYNTEYAPGSL